MSEKRKRDTAKLLLKTAEDLSTLADSVRALGVALADSSQGTEKPKPEKKVPEITLEKVRGVLAEKSRDGFTAEVREIIQSFGADRLSEVNPEYYISVLKKAEELGNV